jgi:hypothetical protein
MRVLEGGIEGATGFILGMLTLRFDPGEDVRELLEVVEVSVMDIV